MEVTRSKMQPVCLTVAGSDPSGGAGLQADLKVFHELGVYGAAAVTLLTVQNSRALTRVLYVEPDFVVQQIRAVLDEFTPDTMKTGALGAASIVAAVSALVRETGIPCVVDPVMKSSSGKSLLEEEACELLISELLPLSYLITPNTAEASRIAGVAVTTVGGMKRAAEKIAELGAANVLIKGGHLEGENARDVLFTGGEFVEYSRKRVPSRDIHGTGCVLSAAITASLARGMPLADAVRSAKAFLADGLERSRQTGEQRGEQTGEQTGAQRGEQRNAIASIFGNSSSRDGELRADDTERTRKTTNA